MTTPDAGTHCSRLRRLVGGSSTPPPGGDRIDAARRIDRRTAQRIVQRTASRSVWLAVCLAACLATCLAACQPAAIPPAPAAALAAAPATATPAPLIFYDWTDELPPTIFDAFTAETGIPVVYRGYDAMEEALANVRAGRPYDVVVMDTHYMQPLLDAGLLAPINRSLLTNFKNVAADFRGLAIDPDNRYSIPYSWGTTGLLVRPDLAAHRVTSWNDLWDPAFAGRTAIWSGTPREGIAFTLKALGFSANSEDPQELAEAQARLLDLRATVHFGEEWDTYSMANALARGDVTLSQGYAFEARTVRDRGRPVEYVLPQEGALLWSDNFVIPAVSARPDDAARLIDYLLRPDVGATIMQTMYLRLANDAALAALPDALRNDPLIFAPADQLHNAEILLPLSAAGEARYAAVWDAFLAAPGPGD